MTGTAVDTRSLYTVEYFQGGRDDGYADYRGSERVLRAEFRSAVAYLRRFAGGGRLLELGCAYGFFLAEARHTFDVVGVELAEEAVAFCRAGGLDVLSGDASEAEIARRGPFDVAVMLDVIEHLERPEHHLALLARLVRPGGHLMLTTGDWGSLVARWTGARWRLMTPPQHLWFFDTRTIARLLRRSGFRLLAIDHPWKFVPLKLMSYQLGRILGAQRVLRHLDFGSLGLPVNLFDAMRVIAVREPPDGPPASRPGHAAGIG